MHDWNLFLQEYSEEESCVSPSSSAASASAPTSRKMSRTLSITPGLKDEFCDPDNPKKISFEDISAAAYKIRNGIQKTPCTVWKYFTCYVYVMCKRYLTTMVLTIDDNLQWFLKPGNKLRLIYWLID